MGAELLALLGGGLMRALPELFAWANKKTDNKHELAMMDKQIELGKQKHDQQIEYTQLTGEIEIATAKINATAAAVAAQLVVTGNSFIDMLNILVRPLTTYYFLGMYGLVKISLLVVAYSQGVDFWVAILQVYDDEDRAALWGIIGFWFVGREFGKQNGTASGYSSYAKSGQF